MAVCGGYAMREAPGLVDSGGGAMWLSVLLLPPLPSCNREASSPASVSGDSTSVVYHEHDQPHGFPHYGITHDDQAHFSSHCEPCMKLVHGAHFHGYEHGQLTNPTSLTLSRLLKPIAI
ncbi:hypothetical protein EGR_04332 [Echinococcus granulosus]|uniref:Uncharacterized protein n=1 Tax=Echinococcus granulosus TaxID=6210 RepID=W6UIJ8_ECHGR|nr:hypothetical protein EGR_04332 [Echinococcus granulosus]EUB60893.1 hypothetical protein EGR_04332 [Echinococcus granulosus]